MNLAATATNKLLKINRKTINNYFTEFRELIFEESIREQTKELGVFEHDESYFGTKTNQRKTKNNRKILVFRILKGKGKIFVSIIPYYLKEESMLII